MNAGTDGWLIFDGQDRLVFVTQNLAQIADHREDFEIGISYEALLRRRFKRGIFGNFKGTEDEFVAGQLDRRRNPDGQNYSYRRPDGRSFMVRSRRLPDGGFVNVHTDITEAKATEERATRAEATLRDAISSGGERWTIWGRDERLLLYSEAVGRGTLHPEDFEIGIDYETFLRRRIDHGVIPDACGREAPFLAEQLALFRSGQPQDTTFRRADGVWFLRRLRRTADGGTVETYIDVTELKAAEQRAQEAERKVSRAEAMLSDAINASTDLWFIYDHDDRLAYFNESFKNSSPHPGDYEIGTSYETMLRRRFRRGMFATIDEDEDTFVAKQLAARRSPEGQTLTYQRADGVWLLMRTRRMANGGIVNIYTDISRLKQAEQRVAQAEQQLRQAIDSIGEAFVLYDRNDCLALWNRKYEEFSEMSIDLVVKGTSYETLLRVGAARGEYHIPADRVDAWVAEKLERRRTLTHSVFDHQVAGRWLRVIDRRTSEGETVGIRTDITDLKAAEERVRQAEAWLRDAINTSGNVWMIWDRDDKLVLHTSGLQGITPHPEDIEVGIDYETLLRRRVKRGIVPGLAGREEEYIREQLAMRKSPAGQNFVYQRADGRWHMVRSHRMSDGGIAQVFTDVTDLKVAEERVRRAEAWLRDAVNTSGNVWVIWDRDDKLVLHTLDLEGITPHYEDFEIGIDYETFVRRRLKRGILTNAIGREEEYVQEQLAARRSPEGQNVIYRRPDGQWFMIRSRRMSDGGTVQVYINVTDMKVAEERVSRAEQRLRNAVDCMADGFRLWDSEDRLVLYNRAFQAQSKTPEAQEIGRTYEETLRLAVARGVIDSAIGREEEYIRERLEAHRRADGRPFEMQRADGHWFETREYRTDEGGTVHVRADITERKRREAELGAARDAAEQASRAKSEFLSKMSHDLRTPLNAVLGFSQLLLMERGREALSRQQNDAVATIERTGRHLLSMVEDILDLARIENRAIELTTEPLSLAAVCSEVLTLVRPLAETNRVHISHDVMRPNTPQVLGDRKRVIQVLTNLVSNAIKYGGAGGRVVIAVEPAAGGFVRVGVTDFEPGIPADRQAQLFQPFSRLGQESSATEGTGIGLTIAKGLVERMGGTIGVYSALNEATTFWFSLPEAAAPTTAPDLPVPRGDEIAQVRTLHQVGPATILYIEDTLENLTLVRRLLGRFANIRYLEAETAEQGIEIARREKPDVVLMDMRLPGMSGIEALSVLRADPVTQGMTVIGLTGAAMPHEAQEIKVAGFDGYITKPFRIAALLEALVQALDRRARKTG